MHKITLYPIIIILFTLSAACTHYATTSLSENSSDSLYTWNHIVNIHMEAPQRALELIDTAEMRGTLPKYQGDDLRAIIYKDVLHDLSRAMEYWRGIWQLDSIKNNPKHHLIILMRMSSGSYAMGDYTECIQYATEGLQVAKSIEALVSEGNLLFIIGESMAHIGQQNMAWDYMDRAIRLIEKSSNPKALPDLSYCYGARMSYYMDEEDFASAIAVGEKRVGAIARMGQELSCPLGYVDQQYGYLYSKLAYCYAMSGQKQRGKEYVGKFNRTDFSKHIEGKRQMLSYYRATAQYEELIRIYNEVTDSLSQDTISAEFASDLSRMTEAYEKLGDIKKALSLQRRVEVIKDSLAEREHRDKALELTIAYQSHEKDLLLKETKIESQRNLLFAVFMCVLFIAMCAVTCFFYKYSRMTLYKNRMLVAQMDDFNDCRSQLEAAREKIRVLSVDVKKTMAVSENEETANARIFKRLEEMMENEKLFLVKDLTREMVIQRLHIDKNRLPQVLQENADGMGLPAYVNDFRLRWAVGQLKEHPEFTIQAISDASGFSSIRSFQRLFKEKVKMTPAEYRAAIVKE